MTKGDSGGLSVLELLLLADSISVLFASRIPHSKSSVSSLIVKSNRGGPSNESSGIVSASGSMSIGTGNSFSTKSACKVEGW